MKKTKGTRKEKVGNVGHQKRTNPSLVSMYQKKESQINIRNQAYMKILEKKYSKLRQVTIIQVQVIYKP